MKYSTDKQDKYTLVTLDEDKLDATVAPELKTEFITIGAGGEKNIIIDVAKTKYFDSSGLSAILTGNRVCKNVDGIFALANVQDHPMELIKISQLDSVLNIFPTIEEATDAILMNEVEKELKDSKKDDG
mgnify:CR=1 FL=1